MPQNVLIVPDKFKGTLTALQAAEAIASGWRSVRPGDRLDLLPMSDGGDGFGEIISRLLGAEPIAVATIDAAHQPIEAAWGWHAATKVAVVESARVVGLAMLPPKKFHPYDLDTFGLGAVLRAAAAHGAVRCLVGIGGSATNDGGFGLARAIGWRFLTGANTAIERWTDLGELATLAPPQEPIRFDDLTVAVDVQNLLLGPTGCSRVYGPQKGLLEFDVADRALGRLAEVVTAHTGVDYAAHPGAGAAGGLGFGLLAFAGARLEQGIDIFKRYARLEDHVRASQLVVTGEGAIDAQTLMGKGVGEIAALCQRLGVPCLGIAGVVSERERARERFDATYALAPDLTDTASALREPALWLERAAALAAQQRASH
jgi:glycerate kinase